MYLNWICFGLFIFDYFNGDREICIEYSLSRIMPRIIAFNLQCFSPEGLIEKQLLGAVKIQ